MLGGRLFGGIRVGNPTYCRFRPRYPILEGAASKALSWLHHHIKQFYFIFTGNLYHGNRKKVA